jgi:hypothetical protein
MNLDQQLNELSAKLAKARASISGKQYSSPAEEQEFRDIQARAAHVFALNRKIVPDATDETALDYRRRLAESLKSNSSMRSHDLSREPKEVFTLSEAKIYADAQRNYLKPLDLAPGEIREIKYRDRANRTVTEFAVGRGQSVFKQIFGDMVGVGQRVQFMYDGQPVAVPNLAGPRGF